MLEYICNCIEYSVNHFRGNKKHIKHSKLVGISAAESGQIIHSNLVCFSVFYQSDNMCG